MKLKWNRCLCALLVTALLTVPFVCATGSFSDITDENTARDVEILEMMEVLNGVSPTQFNPAGALTRAQFTKMAIMMLGKGDRVAAYQNYTIFPDVKPGYWASGYINLAVRGEEKFISGYANGTFEPERNITYGQAVTILMRLLGYKDEDVGMRWPDGYLDAAGGIKLTQGLYLPGDAILRRDQAALLFVNLLTTKMKEGGTTFTGKIAPTSKENVILLNAKAVASDGAPAIETTEGIFKLAGTHAPQAMVGRKGTVLLDNSGRAMTFVPVTVGSMQNLTISSAKAGEIKDLNGKEHKLTAETVTYYKGEKTTYGEMFVNLRSGTQATFYFGASGKVEYLFVGDSTAAEAVVVTQDGSTAGFTGLTGGRADYTIYKSGEQVTATALRNYDVATYQVAQNRIVISDTKLKGCYESAYPNTETPTKITVLGCEFKVLPTAVDDLSYFKVGDMITLLVTDDQQVAGVVDAKLLPTETVGLLTEVSATGVKVTLPNGLVLSGKTEGDFAQHQGSLVNVSAYRKEYLSVYPVQTGSARGKLDVSTRTLNGAKLSADLSVFERVGESPVTAITMGEIRTSTVESAKIQYVRYNYKGEVDVLMLDNVTGDRFTYGKASIGSEALEGGNKVMTITVTNGKDTVGPAKYTEFLGASWAGIALKPDKTKVAGSVGLTAVPNITNANWQDDKKVVVRGQTYPVSEAVVCYNRATGKWVTIGEARAFASEMTLYCDTFGVVRGVEVK